MTAYFLPFAIIICLFWLSFLWLTAKPIPRPRQESRYEVLEEQRQIVELARTLDAIDEEVIRLDEELALAEMAERQRDRDRHYTGEELKQMMRKRDIFRRIK